MKTFCSLVALTAVVLALSLVGQNFTYVGASKCAVCHKTDKQGQQMLIWQESSHAKAAAAPGSADGAKIAQAAGVSNPPENPACLKCHAPLFEKAPELKSEGVTCEVCHGPGSEYKKITIMKDRALARQNGLVVYESVEAIKKQCLTCHENAHGKSFDFASSWEKIKHNKPAE